MRDTLNARLLASFLVLISFLSILPGNVARVAMEKAVSGYVPGKTPLRADHLNLHHRSRRELPTSTLTALEREQVVDVHNTLRRTIKTTNMKLMRWNQELADAAQLHSNKCVFEHGNLQWEGKNFSTVGQNLLYATGSGLTMEYVIENFYSEISYYNNEDNTCQPGKVCGHYTQVMWSESDQVGCAKHLCSSMYFPDEDRTVYNANLFTCNYAPGGNVQGVKPYEIGKPCSDCSSGQGWCVEDLCSDCNQNEDPECKCALDCQHCGTVTTDCRCSCKRGYIGTSCERECGNFHSLCNNGWPPYSCDLAESRHYVQDFCPLMCGLCEVATPENPGGCDAEKECPSTLTCGDHGTWNDTNCNCTCTNGYHGDTCEECPSTLTCGEHGTWDEKDCKCICSNGYQGDTCEQCPSTLTCGDHGTWNDKDCICTCSDGYRGDTCEECPSTLTCGDHGTWDVTDCSCTCSAGYHGTTCEEACPVCTDIYPSVCPGWTAYCQKSAYLSYMKEVCKKSCGYCNVPDECQK